MYKIIQLDNNAYINLHVSATNWAILLKVMFENYGKGMLKVITIHFLFIEIEYHNGKKPF